MVRTLMMGTKLSPPPPEPVAPTAPTTQPSPASTRDYDLRRLAVPFRNVARPPRALTAQPAPIPPKLGGTPTGQLFPPLKRGGSCTISLERTAESRPALNPAGHLCIAFVRTEGCPKVPGQVPVSGRVRAPRNRARAAPTPSTCAQEHRATTHVAGDKLLALWNELTAPLIPDNPETKALDL